jgi:hypothetical protein
MPTVETTTPVVQEPRPARRTRPLTEYWDYRTASWRTASPVPVPRRGE